MENIAGQPISCSCFTHKCQKASFVHCLTISCYEGCTLPSTQSEVSLQPSRNFNCCRIGLCICRFWEVCHTCLQLFKASQANSQDQTPQRRSQHRLGRQHQNMHGHFSRGEVSFLHKLESKSTIFGLYFEKVKEQDFQMRFQLRLK